MFVTMKMNKAKSESVKTTATVPLTLDNMLTTYESQNNTIREYELIIKAQNKEIIELKNDLHLCWEESAK